MRAIEWIVNHPEHSRPINDDIIADEPGLIAPRTDVAISEQHIRMLMTVTRRSEEECRALLTEARGHYGKAVDAHHADQRAAEAGRVLEQQRQKADERAAADRRRAADELARQATEAAAEEARQRVAQEQLQRQLHRICDLLNQLANGTRRPPAPSPVPSLPEPTAVVSHEQALYFAGTLLAGLLADNVQLQPASAGAAHLTADGVVATVNHDTLPVRTTDIQATYGAAALTQATPVHLSLGPYTPHALDWAERASIACFSYTTAGQVTPQNPAALRIVQTGLHHAG